MPKESKPETKATEKSAKPKVPAVRKSPASSTAKAAKAKAPTKVEVKAKAEKKPAAPAASKAPAAKKAPAKAPPAKPAAAVAAIVNVMPVLTPDQRRYYVEVAAFYIAERRGFHGGSQMDDWVTAEEEIDRLLREGILKP